MLAQVDSTGRPSLSGIVREYLKSKSPVDDEPYCPALHRLDRPVSGVMLFAKTPVAAGRLSDDIRYKSIRKFYCAIVSPPPESASPGEWKELSQYMVRRRDRGYIADENDPGATPVSLRYRLFDTDDSFSLLLVELITGKRHQIRVQLASLGSPIIGDRFYGSKEILGDGIISLHAHCLCLTHPITKERMTVCAPPPPHMEKFIGSYPCPDDYLKD